MKCHRCKGLMVVDHFIDMEDDSGHLWLRGWHCINCGAVEDPEIYGRRLIRSSWQNQPAGVFAQKRVMKSRARASGVGVAIGGRLTQFRRSPYPL